MNRDRDQNQLASNDPLTRSLVARTGSGKGTDSLAAGPRTPSVACPASVHLNDDEAEKLGPLSVSVNSLTSRVETPCTYIFAERSPTLITSNSAVENRPDSVA